MTGKAADLDDVIVVGAGPGGAVTAWRCAEGGARVLLLERAAALPRYKPCGGGIPASVARHVCGLDSPDEFVDLTITHLRHSWKGRDPVLGRLETAQGEPAPVWMVQRPRFDQYLVRRAEAVGARVRTGVRVSAVAADAEGVTVTSVTGEAWRARYVVGADGARGVVGARVGLRLGKRWGIAREIEIPFQSRDGGPWHPELSPGAAYLDYGTVPNGYAWIFPKRGCLSVGAGMLLPRKPGANGDPETGGATAGPLLKRAIASLLASVGLRYPDESGGADAPSSGRTRSPSGPEASRSTRPAAGAFFWWAMLQASCSRFSGRASSTRFGRASWPPAACSRERRQCIRIGSARFSPTSSMPPRAWAACSTARPFFPTVSVSRTRPAPGWSGAS
jgi:hypothetical protein